jgi:hypothetical protein
MARKPPGEWPERPAGFYDDWTSFCLEVVSARLRQDDDDGGELAAVLLAAGAILGGAGLVRLAAEHKDAIDAQGCEWGIENLSAVAGVGGAVFAAAVGGFGIARLVRMLGRHADTRKVDEVQVRLSEIRREFEALRNELHHGRLTALHHRLAVERMFHDFIER